MASLIDTLIDVLGQEDAEYKKLLDEGDHNVVYGMMVGYGMSLQLRNQDTSKGLRGIEVRQRQLSVRILSGYRIFWFRNRHVLMPLTNWNSSVWKM